MCLPESASPMVVLDTNAVLDWLVFGNPESDALAAAILAGELRWVATLPMRDELAHVLARGHLDGWKPDASAVWAAWDAHCRIIATPISNGPPGRLRCSDPDDQKFIDLAVAAPARWLVSRDRAVLKLARRLRERGIEVTTPPKWAALSPAPG